jgi:membrane-bound ClpP family serine protease
VAGELTCTIGVVLILLGAALAVAEAHVPSGGVPGGAAVVGGIVLVATGAGVSLAVALAVALAARAVAAGYLWIVLHEALVARRRAARSGAERLVGRVGEVRAVPAPLGQVFLDGALWRARLWLDDDAALQRGDPIVVEHVDGLTLTVRRAEVWEVAPWLRDSFAHRPPPMTSADGSSPNSGHERSR